jgi:tetratricopeptide (TPR) repeat protein
MPYDARYEQARCLGRAGQQDAAQQKYQALFREALAEGVLPPLDSSFRHVLESGKQEGWAKLMQETAAKCAEKKVRPVIITLAWQCHQLGDTALADVLLGLALKDVPADEKPTTLLAATHFLQQTGRYDRAEQLVRELLSDERLTQSASLWRLAGTIADNRGDTVRGIDCLEKALDIEFAYLPEVFNVQPIRNDYGRLLNHYEWLANAATTLKVSSPPDLFARVVKAADRWRTLDPESDHVCDRVAKIIRTVGGDGSAELAWDYATTPLAQRPNESAPWLALANTMRQEGRTTLTDKCYDMAYQAEPTNAQILWDRAQHLMQQGKTADGHALLKQITNGTWQPRFDSVKAQARQVLEGR